ncbi:MFS transporter [Pseudonocardia sp. DSM 110487]|uniref:MFS transporter n=1 Tax=Pseudonocardia sp. DSM 110487 TaxID=2865833 RepID=UPI001C6A2B96|nr:MFS transporter [Pseudonocardia sp. DSM 110487]QYN39457.1 MFS transporter [Pseudonocardia sp. DSM 110487]
MVPPTATETDRSAATRPPLRYASVLVLTLMQVTLVIDNSVVNVALPVIRDELGFSAAGLSWVVTSYALAFGGLVLLSGRVGSIIGPRRALLIGISVFVAASALGGLAVTPGMLIAARVLQGVGAALAAPSTLVLLMAITKPGVQRARAMSLFVLSIGLGAALGLTLGGALTSGFGWAWVMFVNVPIGAVVFFGIRALVPEADRHSGRLDVGGAVFSTIGMLALVYGLTAAADHGWASGSVIASFVLAGAGLVALVLTERRHRAPVVPLSFFTSMASAAPLLAMMLIPAGQFGFLYFAALYTQGVLGFSPLQTGLSVLPFTAGMLATNVTVSRLVTRHGERVVGSAGMIGLLTGLGWLSRLTPDSGYLDGLLGPFLLLGLGAGLTIAPLTAVIMHNAPREHLGAASSLNQAMQQLGGAAGLAVLSTVFAHTAGGSGAATGISTALTVATAFPLLALLLFAVWARRITTL